MKITNSLKIQEQDNTAPNTSHALGKRRILLVEDDPANMLVASVLLETLGYEFDTASNGSEAVRKARIAQYGVILMDMRMPDINGEQATRLIRENDRKLGRSPSKILCMTANAFESDRKKCFAAGMDDYLSKPYDPEELQYKLDLLLNMRK